MASSILLPRDIDVNKVSFGLPKQLNGGARVVPIGYDGKAFIFQTARMSCNYGLSKWGEGVTAKYSLDGSFKDKDMNKSLENFFNFLKSLDEHLVKSGVANSVEWFKKRHSSEEVVEALYTHAVRYPKDKATGEISHQYPPSFKMNIPMQDGKVQVDVYDGKGNKIELTEADGMTLKGATVSAIVKCTGVWLAGGNFGLTFRVAQLRVESQRNALNEYAFQEDDDTVCEHDDECEHHMDVASEKKNEIETSDDEAEPEHVEVVAEHHDDGIDPPEMPKSLPTKKRATKKN
jgi:Zn-finger nucleic acid-binding protein